MLHRTDEIKSSSLQRDKEKGIFIQSVAGNTVGAVSYFFASSPPFESGVLYGGNL